MSYTSVSCSPKSSVLRHYGVFDGTHCSADVCCGGVFWRWRPHATGHPSTLILCSFTNQVLAQHDLFRYWKETWACKADAVSETDVFVSSAGNFNISALDHMKNLRNISLVGNTGHFDEIDFASSEGLEGTKVLTIKPPWRTLLSGNRDRSPSGLNSWFHRSDNLTRLACPSLFETSPDSAEHS